jgi:hypothetical protein
MTIDISEIDRAARPAAWAEDIKPRRTRDQRCPYRRRPQHVAARGQLLVPALDNALRLIGGVARGADFDVESPRVRIPISLSYSGPNKAI